MVRRARLFSAGGNAEQERSEGEVFGVLCDDKKHSHFACHKNYIVLKIIFIGDPAVGKSSLLERISENEFKENIPTTLGVDFIFKNVSTNEAEIKIQIFDTAGQERFRSLINSYYKLSDGIIMVFDITDRSSMINLVENWTKTLILNCKVLQV